MPLARVIVLLLLASAPLVAGGKKGADAGIALYLEAQQGSHPKMIFNQFVAGRERPFHRVPEIGSRDIAAFKPFPSESGEGYGVLLQLKPAAVNRLGAVTAANLDRWMIARVNGRIVDGVLIDQPINDGKWVIWKGVAASEIELLDKKFPRVGERKPRG
jgi:hypothetical protein